MISGNCEAATRIKTVNGTAFLVAQHATALLHFAMYFCYCKRLFYMSEKPIGPSDAGWG